MTFSEMQTIVEEQARDLVELRQMLGELGAQHAELAATVVADPYGEQVREIVRRTKGPETLTPPNRAQPERFVSLSADDFGGPVDQEE